MVSLCFIIACKYYKNYKTLIPTYIENIKKFYSSAKIILVDNNSLDSNEFYSNLSTKYQDLTILENTSSQKFEVGAYNFAAKYILEHNLNFDYYICTQDTFILMNYYNFDDLQNRGVTACPLSTFYRLSEQFNMVSIYNNVFNTSLDYNPNYIYTGCWCSSYIVNYDNLYNIFRLSKNIEIVNRAQSCDSERWLGIVLKKLNDNILTSIIGSENELASEYDQTNFESVSKFINNPNYSKKFGHYFLKICQQKTELTQ